MKKIYLILLAVAVVGITSCASKKYAKQGLKYEQAGMYEMAAEAFYLSMVANPKNIDAAIGLKKNGQRLLDDKVLAVHHAYSSGNEKETVYKFLDAQAYQKKVGSTGVSISMPERTEGFFNEAKPRYLSKRYDEARLLLDEEKFKQAEEIFAEIKKIDPSYQGVDEHMKVSVCEPLYRDGSQLLLSGFNRKAYEKFNTILVNHGAYKDAKDLRDEALSKGMITIAISNFSNSTSKKDANLLIEGKISSALTSLNNPFIQVVDIKNSKTFVDEQQRAINTGSRIEVGKMLAAKAIISGAVLRFDSQEGKTLQEEKRGYIKEVVTLKNKETGEETKETRYHKVSYKEIRKENKVLVGLRYQLSSSETSAVMVSDAMEHRSDDAVHFVVFQGDKNNLVPGYWEFADKKSAKDKVNDTQNEVNQLQQLLNAKQTIKSIDALEAEALDAIAKRVASKINLYNPEQ
jgi:tetratricopeptide (TPR) repeat protein